MRHNQIFDLEKVIYVFLDKLKNHWPYRDAILCNNGSYLVYQIKVTLTFDLVQNWVLLPKIDGNAHSLSSLVYAV